MHRRDYKLIARVIAETAQDAHQRDRWTAAFMQALHSSPDNFNATKFLEGVTAYSNEVRAGRAPRAGGAPQPPASSTEGRADPAQPNGFGASQVLADEFDDAQIEREHMDAAEWKRQFTADFPSASPDDPQHFADENTPADHYYRS